MSFPNVLVILAPNVASYLQYSLFICSGVIVSMSDICKSLRLCLLPPPATMADNLSRLFHLFHIFFHRDHYFDYFDHMFSEVLQHPIFT